jgi:hypothetical protein
MAATDDANQPAQSSHLFMLRFWLEDVGSGQTDWRCKIQHVSSGEARYFRDWPALEAFVEELLRWFDPKGTHADGVDKSGRAPRSP